MKRCFVTLKSFVYDWKNIGLSEFDMVQLENSLILNPHEGAVIKDTNGIRKLRYRLPNKGKSGGLRVFYLDIPEKGKLYLITLISKNEKENLSRAEINELAKLSTHLKEIA